MAPHSAMQYRLQACLSIVWPIEQRQRTCVGHPKRCVSRSARFFQGHPIEPSRVDLRTMQRHPLCSLVAVDRGVFFLLAPKMLISGGIRDLENVCILCIYVMPCSLA